jgi:succinoglycan biosynthesis transport protein ExoP
MKIFYESSKMFQSQWRLKDGGALDLGEHTNESAQAADNIARLISAMRRQAMLFTAVSLASVAIGTLYVQTATPLYTASATIVLDNRQLRAIHDVSMLSDAPRADAIEVVETQVAVLSSGKIGLAVIKHLNLLSEDPAFTKPTWINKIWTSILGTLNAIVGDNPLLNGADQEFNRQLKILRMLNSNLLVIRVGHSFVLQVDYTSPNPSRAAEVANAYADAYVLEQVNLGVEATRRARSWLQQRTEELRRLSNEADFAAQKFKSDHNLFATKGALISDQQFTEMMSQLVTQRSATAEAKARYLRIKNIIDTYQTGSAVTESLANPVIIELRTKYFDASKRMIDLERKLGPDHRTVIDLKNAIEDLKTQLFQELGRIAEMYRSDYEVAAAREKALAENLAQQQTIAVAANDDQVQLRQLEQKAESSKTLYQTFLQRYQETAQQEGFPLTDAQFISAANPPLVPSYPRTPLVLAISLALGILAGASVVILRERMDQVFRTTDQVHAELGVGALGLLPIISSESLPEHVSGNVAPMMRYTIDNPISVFAETLRSAKVAADHALKDRSPKIIGLVSLFPNEGKSTVAKNFGSLLALQGASTLLIDADTRKFGLTRAMGYEKRLLAQSEDSASSPSTEVVRYEVDSSLQILPHIYAKDDALGAEGLTSAKFQALLQGIDRSFEYIVIDFPPIGLVVGARGMAASIDAFILVIEWGVTSRGAVRAALAKDHLISEKLLGVILNKVDMKKLMSYEHYGSDGYYHQHYEAYYQRPEKL